MDKSIDCCDTAQLVIYIRGVDKDFNIGEELAVMKSMKGRTTGKDIYTESIKHVNKKLAYNFTKLVAICTDGAQAICGKNTKAVSLIQEVIKRRVITHHCIIHQQALCDKILKFDIVMPVVVSVLNYRRDDVVIRTSASHSVDQGFISQVESYQKTLKNGIYSFPALRSAK